MATTKAFELAQLSANVTSTTGLSTLASGIVSSEKIGAGIAVPLGNIHSKSDINNLLILESEDANADIIGLDTSGSTRLRSAAGAFSFWAGGDASSTGAANSTSVLTIADNGIINVASTASSTGSSTGALVVAGGVGIAENLNVGGNITVSGDLTVEGTSVTLNTTDLNVEDKNITLNYHASNDTSASAGGAGITIQDAVDASNDASILWDATNDKFDFSHTVNVTGNLVSDGLTVDGHSTFNTASTLFANLNYGGANRGRFTTDGIDIKIEATSNLQFIANSVLSTKINGTGDISFYEDNGGSPQVGMHWDYTDGRLGIGTDSPGALLDVNDDGVTDNAWNTLAKFRPDLSDAHAEASIHIQSYPSTTIVANRKAGIQSIDDAGNARSLILNKDGGNVGIGTDSPDHVLDLGKTSGDVAIRIKSTSAGDPTLLFDSAVANRNAVIQFLDQGSYVAGRIQYVHNGDRLDFQAGSSTGATMSVVNGKVGINTTAPDAPLHVSDTSPHIDIGPQGGNRGKIGYHNLDVIIGSTSSTGSIIFKNNIGSTDSPQTSGDQKMIITDDGVGIGDFGALSSGAKLEVVGSASGNWISIIKNTHNSNGNGLKVLAGDDADTTSFRVSTYDNTTLFDVRGDGEVTATGAYNTDHVRHDLQPSLSFDFANSKTLDPRIQYQRRGTATYFDDSGVMRYATHNVPRIDHDPSTGECKGLLVEEERTNYMSYPNEFSFGQWSTPGLVPIQNVGLAPDGTYSADLIMLDYSYTARHFGYKVTPGAFLSGVTYNISCYFKAYGGFSESCKLGYRVDSDTQGGDLYGPGFQINAGEPAGNGWYRHSLTVAVGTNASLNFAEFILGDQNGYQPTAGTGAYMWGFTVEKASNNTGATFPTSFIPTKANLTGRASTTATYTRSDGVITTAGQHQPRYDHALKDGIWRPKGLLLESAATNLSQNFYYPASTLRWNSGVQNATITPDVTQLAPDGTYNNVVRFKETTSNASTTASVYKPIAGTANTQRTFSVYAKKKELKMMRLYFDGTTPLCGQVIYNLDLGTIHVAQNPSGTDAWGIEDAGNGWWRCWFSGTVTGGQSTYYIHIDSADDFGNVIHQNTVNNGFYLWGPQMEYGGAPTSYIYTDDGATTRTADLAEAEAVTREGDNIKMYDMSFHNTIESTIYGEGTSISGNNDTGSNPCIWGLTDGTSSNRYLLRRYDNDTTNDPNYSGFTFRLQQTMPDGTSYNNDFFSPTANGLGEWDDAEIHKMALSISPGNQIGAADGKDAGMTSVTNMPPYTQATMVQIGHAGSSDYWNGHIRKLSYYPTQLNMTELKALTESN